MLEYHWGKFNETNQAGSFGICWALRREKGGSISYVIAMPVAFPRFNRKKWPIDEIQGVLRKAPPRPFKTLYTLKKCQYSTEKLATIWTFDRARKTLTSAQLQ
jgi:hypothetical protein